MAVVRDSAKWLADKRPALRGRGGVILVLLLVWAVVTAAGAGEAADSTTWLDIPNLDWLSYVFLVLGVVSVLFMLLAAVLGRRRVEGGQGRRRPLWPLLLLFLLFFALRDRLPEPDQDGFEVEEAQPTNPQAPAVPQQGSDGLEANELVALAAIMATAAGILLWSRRGTENPVRSDEASIAVVLAPAVEKAAHDLSLGTDPRSAVLLAYDGLEGALRRHGRPRRMSETPVEHLRRVLRTTSIDTEPLLRLAWLYEIARFSTHSVSASQQRQAAESLRQVQRQLVEST